MITQIAKQSEAASSYDVHLYTAILQLLALSLRIHIYLHLCKYWNSSYLDRYIYIHLCKKQHSSIFGSSTLKSVSD